jgi:hypothetical protein
MCVDKELSCVAGDTTASVPVVFTFALRFPEALFSKAISFYSSGTDGAWET